jgi:hypothetical protein
MCGIRVAYHVPLKPSSSMSSKVFMSNPIMVKKAQSLLLAYSTCHSVSDRGFRRSWACIK